MKPEAAESPCLTRKDEDARAAKARLRGFELHLAVFALVMAVLIAIALVQGRGAAWIVVPPVAWGGLLGLHAAYAMGLFDLLRKEKSR